MSHPWLSVVVPTHNGARYLSATLASIACQAGEEIEVLAIDDGSSDATSAILDAYTRRLPLRVFLRPHVGNWVTNTNYGLAVARGDYACILHQDDVWLPGRLRVLRQMVSREPTATLFLHPSHYIDHEGKQVGIWRCPLRAGKQRPERVVERLLVQNFIAVPAPLFARAAALRVGLLDEGLWYTADWDFWLRLVTAGLVVYYPRPLAAFRIHALSQTAQARNRTEEMRRQIDRVLEKHLVPWEAGCPARVDVGRVARISAAVNHALASRASGVNPNWLALAGRFFTLGPAGWWRFLRDSRIIERVSARLQAK